MNLLTTVNSFLRLGLPLCGLVLVCGCQNRQAPPPPIDPATREIVLRAEQAMEAYEYGHALALADSASQRVPRAAEPYFLKGLIHSRTLRWEDAEAAYRAVLDRNPEFPGVWNNLGNNELWQGDYEDALAYYYNEIELHPAPTPWSGIGRIYRELGAIDSAAYAFERAIELDSTYAPAYTAYARLLEDEGEFERALAMIERVLALTPDASEVAYQMGSLLERLGRYEEALPYLEAAAKAVPWHTESHYKLGQVLQRLGHEEESRRVLAEAERLWKLQAEISSHQKSIGSDPQNPYRHAALATAFRMAGRYDEAIQTYKVALTLDPKNLEFQTNLASLYFLKQDTTAAVQTYRQVLEQDPTMVEVWVNLGILYALSGRTEDARQAWQQALVHRPNDPTILGYLARLEAG